jgi:ABC-type nitrate/sulfonate/bicarbonate transport system permease component
MSEKIRWGILATGNVANRFAVSLNNISEQAELVAVGSRNQKSATAFAKKYNKRSAYRGGVGWFDNGVALASIFVHSALSERATMPYVIASQAIPIVALAPIIVVAAGRGNTAVIFIAVYLTFFPVTVAQTRGLRSPDPRSLELMRSMAASKWDIYRKVRLPASVPYLFTALKIAAAAAIVGAIVGEGPGGVRDGLGRSLLNYNQYYSSGPEKLWATILIASLTGIFFFTCVRIAEILSTRRRGRNASAGASPASGVTVKGA